MSVLQYRIILAMHHKGERIVLKFNLEKRIENNYNNHFYANVS